LIGRSILSLFLQHPLFSSETEDIFTNPGIMCVYISQDFYSLNPCGRNMTVCSTEAKTEINNRGISWDVPIV
jgi:hypothetical protein